MIEHVEERVEARVCSMHESDVEVFCAVAKSPLRGR